MISKWFPNETQHWLDVLHQTQFTHQVSLMCLREILYQVTAKVPHQVRCQREDNLHSEVRPEETGRTLQDTSAWREVPTL